MTREELFAASVALAILAAWIAILVAGVRLARRKGRSPHWMWFGVHPLSGLVALLVLLRVRGLRDCPHCGARLPAALEACSACGRSLPPPPDPAQEEAAQKRRLAEERVARKRRLAEEQTAYDQWRAQEAATAYERSRCRRCGQPARAFSWERDEEQLGSGESIGQERVSYIITARCRSCGTEGMIEVVNGREHAMDLVRRLERFAGDPSLPG
jgi:hypothetical protein